MKGPLVGTVLITLAGCGGGGSAPIAADSPLHPTPLEQSVIDRAAGIVGFSHPVRIYRDWYTPGPDGRTWETIGADYCTPDHDPRWCVNARIAGGVILIAHWSAEVVDQFNAAAVWPLDPCLFSLRRLASLTIHESHHLPPYNMAHGSEMTEADQTAMGQFMALHADWIAEREDERCLY